MWGFNGNSGDQSSAGKHLGTGPLLTRQALVRSKNAYREAKKSALDRLPPVASALLHMNVGELERNLLRIEGGPYDLVSGHRGGWVSRLRRRIARPPFQPGLTSWISFPGFEDHPGQVPFRALLCQRVRRQRNWDRCALELKEGLAHLVGDIRRRLCRCLGRSAVHLDRRFCPGPGAL